MMEEYDEAEAIECAEEDWEMDRQGRSALDRTLFCDALFQLADMWTHTTEPAEYVDFLWRLLGHIAHKPGSGNGMMAGDQPTGTAAADDVYLWKDDRDIAYDPCYAEWEASAPGDDAAPRSSSTVSSSNPSASSARRPRLSRSARLSSGSLASPSPRLRGSRWSSTRDTTQEDTSARAEAAPSPPPSTPALVMAPAPAPLPAPAAASQSGPRVSPRWWRGTAAFKAHSAAAWKPQSPGRFFLNNGYYRRKEDTRGVPKHQAPAPKPVVAVSRIGGSFTGNSRHHAAAHSAAGMLTGAVPSAAAGSCTYVDMSLGFNVDNTRVNPMPHATPFAPPTIGRPSRQQTARRPTTTPAIPLANPASLTQSLPLPPRTAPPASGSGLGSQGPHLPPLAQGGDGRGGAKAQLAAAARLNSYVAATATLSERLAMSNEVATSRPSNLSLFKLGKPWSPRRRQPPPRWRPQTSG